jgi:hypothetical protein
MLSKDAPLLPLQLCPKRLSSENTPAQEMTEKRFHLFGQSVQSDRKIKTKKITDYRSLN